LATRYSTIPTTSKDEQNDMYFSTGTTCVSVTLLLKELTAITNDQCCNKDRDWWV